MNFIQNLDENILASLNKLIGISPLLDLFFRFCAEYLILSVPLSLVIAWFLVKKAKKSTEIRVDLLEMTFAGIFGWQIINGIIKFFYFRERPYVSGEEFRELFFHRPDQSFPSDHTTLIFALVVYIYLLGWKKAGNYALIIALIISFARVVTAIHWPFDILGGFLVGAFSAYIFWYLRKPIRKYLVLPIVKLITRIGL